MVQIRNGHWPKHGALTRIGALAAVARANQGLEPRSVGIDEETFSLDFVTEEQRLTGPTSMRFSMVKKLTLRKQPESIW